jgi:antitoxin ParD1/3/4
MQKVEKISIALPPEMTALIRKVVMAREYASTSEGIRDALREWTYKRELRQCGLDALRAMWDEAVNDTRPHVPAEEVLNRLRGKYQALVETSLK